MTVKIGLIHFDPHEDNFSQSAINLADRVQFLPKLADELGLQAVSVPADDLLNATAEILEKLSASLRDCTVFWRFGRTALMKDLRALEEIVKDLSDGPFFETADAIDESFNLSHFYPLFKKEGLPQAATTLIPIPRALCLGDRGPAVKHLKKRLPWWLPKEGVFLRTFYSTRKGFPGLNFADNKKELLDRCWNQIEHFREQNIEIGGFAIRDFLDLRSIWDSQQRFSIPVEYRIFVLNGSPLFWVYHLPLEELRYQLKDEDWDKLGSPSDEQLREMLEYARRAAAQLKTRYLTIDFAVLSSGELTLVEANPGFCAGWNHRGALVGIFAQVLQSLAGRPLLSLERLHELADELDVDFWREGEVFGCVPS